MKKVLILFLVLTASCAFGDKLHSVKTSFVLSAIIPGSGDFYARNYQKGSIALFREIALLATYFHFDNQAESFENSSHIFANKIVNAPINSSSDYFDLISKQLNSDIYNENVRLNAQNYYGYGSEGYYDFVNSYSISPENAWDWESTENLDKYKKYRANRQTNLQYRSIVIGSIFANHIFSAISSAVRTNSDNNNFLEKHSLSFQPNILKSGVSINYGYKF